MLISDIPSTISYVYTGVDTFPVPFSFYGLTTVKVGYRADSDPTSASPYVPLVYEIDYTVTGVKGSENDGDQAFKSGSVTLTSVGAAKVPSNGIVVVMRETPLEQQFAYNELDNFPAKSHENGLGRQAVISQEITAKLSRVLMVPPGADAKDLLQTTLSTMLVARDDAQNANSAAQAAKTAAGQSAVEAAASANTAAQVVLDATENAINAATTQADAAAASAADAAQSALDAAAAVPENLKVRVDAIEGKTAPATTTARGIGRVATSADLVDGATISNGPAFLAAGSDAVTTTPTPNAVPQADASGRIHVGFIPGTFVGDIRLLPFRAADLATHCPGWHFCNGDLYPLSGEIGAALAALPANFKTDWGIAVSGANISIPNMFYSDGRGFFLRAADGVLHQVGDIELDAMQRLTGTFQNSSPGGAAYFGGASYGTGVLYSEWAGTSRIINRTDNAVDSTRLVLDSSRQARTAGENRPLNIGMTPAIYLGV